MDNHHHAIHLGAAWEPPSPAAASGAAWTRRFGRPTGLGPSDRAVLVVARAGVAAEVLVNAVRLPPLVAGVEHWSHDVTPLLRDRNELVLVLSAAVGGVGARGADGGVDRASHGRCPLPVACGVVTLEIVCGAAGGAGGRGS